MASVAAVSPSNRRRADASDEPAANRWAAAQPERVAAPSETDAGATEPVATLTLDLQSTLDLLARARAGDEAAWEVVFRRCERGLRRFAAGRLPVQCRGMTDTEDLVQDTVVSALKRLDHLEFRHEGALLAYLRQAVLNRIIDEVRRRNRRPALVSLPDDQADQALSPLELVIGRQNVDRYELALARLRPRDREVIVMRLEHQAEYAAVAEHFGLPTPNAARVAVKRALFRLAQEMARQAPSANDHPRPPA